MHHLTFTFILTKVVLHKAADIIMASMLDLYSSTMKRTPIRFFFFTCDIFLRRNVFSITATLEGYIKLFCLFFNRG
uniref:Putative secreted protein n=1 Tax=Rhipicephalus microplus TaxID=6941 RepID=A0A6G5A1W3_RHIMP